MTPFERLDADYRGLGVTTGPHPMRYLREALDAEGVVPAQDLWGLPNGRRVRVAGAVITRQRPGTAKGFCFITLEDETGVSNLILRPQIFQQHRAVATTESFLVAEGVLQKQDGVLSVRADRLKPFVIAATVPPSHDFH